MSATILPWLQAIGTIGTLIGLIVAMLSLRRNQRIHQEREANASWRTYDSHSLEHPRLAMAGGPDMDIARRMIGTGPEGRILFEQYQWYVSIMLLAMEDILRTYTTQDWKNTIDAHLKRHEAYLTSPEFHTFVHHLSPELRAIIERNFPPSAATAAAPAPTLAMAAE